MWVHVGQWKGDRTEPRMPSCCNTSYYWRPLLLQLPEQSALSGKEICYRGICKQEREQPLSDLVQQMMPLKQY